MSVFLSLCVCLSLSLYSIYLSPFLLHFCLSFLLLSFFLNLYLLLSSSPPLLLSFFLFLRLSFLLPPLFFCFVEKSNFKELFNSCLHLSQRKDEKPKTFPNSVTFLSLTFQTFLWVIMKSSKSIKRYIYTCDKSRLISQLDAFWLLNLCQEVANANLSTCLKSWLWQQRSPWQSGNKVTRWQYRSWVETNCCFYRI